MNRTNATVKYYWHIDTASLAKQNLRTIQGHFKTNNNF